MTTAMVVYESIFGATRRAALAVAGGLEPSAAVRVTEVGEAPHAIPDEVDLLVVGGPTHAFGLSRPNTRAEAARRTRVPLVSGGDGVREGLADLREHPGLLGATFGTRVLWRGVPRREPGCSSTRRARCSSPRSRPTSTHRRPWPSPPAEHPTIGGRSGSEGPGRRAGLRPHARSHPPGEEQEMDNERRVVDFAGVAIGTVDDDGSVSDFGGVRFGVLTKDDVVDFAGVRVGAPEDSWAGTHR